MKYTAKNHPDHENLGSALSKMIKVTKYVDEKKREYECINKVLTLAQKFSDKKLVSFSNIQCLTMMIDLLYDHTEYIFFIVVDLFMLIAFISILFTRIYRSHIGSIFKKLLFVRAFLKIMIDTYSYSMTYFSLLD